MCLKLPIKDLNSHKIVLLLWGAMDMITPLHRPNIIILRCLTQFRRSSDNRKIILEATGDEFIIMLKCTFSFKYFTMFPKSQCMSSVIFRIVSKQKKIQTCSSYSFLEHILLYLIMNDALKKSKSRVVTVKSI